ncbi:MAG: hypothetical protein AABX02_04080, partial [archaeon]
GLVFFVRATRDPMWKRENIVNAVLAGVSFALMAITWSAFNQLVPVLLGIGFLQFVLWISENHFEKAKHYAQLWGISFIIFAIAATFESGTFWLEQFGGFLGPLFLRNAEIIKAPEVAVFLLLFFGFTALLYHLKSRQKIPDSVFKKAVAVVVLFFVFVPLIAPIVDLSFNSGDVLGRTIGEESTGHQYFGNKYSLLILFAILAVPIMGYLLIRRHTDYNFLVVPLVWVVVIFFMAWVKLKFTFYWGLPLALCGAVLFGLALRWMASASITTQKVMAVGMGFLLLGSMAAGIVFVTSNVPNIESSYGWKEALFWSQKNLPDDARIFNWWDEGHWISFLTGRKTLIDNRNADTQATVDVATFILSTNTEEAVERMTKNNSNFILFGNDLLQKLPNLAFYAYNITNGSDPRIQGMGGFVNRCSEEKSPLTQEVVYVCGSNRIEVSEMNKLPTTWTATPNNLQNGTPFFIYRDSRNRWIYAFTQPANQTMLVRMWFGEPSTQTYLTEVYRNDGDVRVYQLNESAIAPPVNVSEEEPVDLPSDVNSDAQPTDANTA